MDQDAVLPREFALGGLLVENRVVGLLKAVLRETQQLDGSMIRRDELRKLLVTCIALLRSLHDRLVQRPDPGFERPDLLR